MRLSDELEERGIIASYTEKMEGIVPGQILICKGNLSKGFCYSDLDLYIIADKDLFGKEKQKRKLKKKYKGSKIQSFLELSPGDYVVHEQYGIGVFQGIEQIVVEGISKDNLKIEYAEDNISFHIIHPPLTRTNSSAPLPVPKEFMAAPEKVGQGLAKHIMSRRFIICHNTGQKIQTLLCYLFPLALGSKFSEMTAGCIKEENK